MNQFWKDLSIAKKLYTMVAIMVVMVGCQILILKYAVNTLSAMRIFVSAAAQLNDSQKDSIFELYQYAITKNPEYYLRFKEHLTVPAGYKKARRAMLACGNIKTCPQMPDVIEGFTEGRIPTDDIPRLITTMRHLRGFPHMGGAVSFWRKVDGMLDEFKGVGKDLHQEIQAGSSDPEIIKGLMNRIEVLNRRYTSFQQGFIRKVNDGSRLLEKIFVSLLIVIMFVVGGISVFLTFRLVTYLNEHIQDVKRVAEKVGSGDFTQRIKVSSKDGLGQMAEKLNQMIEDLYASIGKKERAESANKVKSLFLANMSHEVRTPLGVIMGMTEILKDKELSDESRQKYLSIIEQTGQNLQQIINDILDISKVEAGHLDIDRSKFAVNSFIRELNSSLQVLAKRGKNILRFEELDGVPKKIVSDRGRTRQILTNLIGNALKFTHEGEVRVTYGVEDHFVVFRVKDSGIGIPKAQQRKLFRAFSQVDHSSSRQYGGTGLGLLLSKRLAQSLGGDVVLESSRPGFGSVFTFRFPLITAKNYPLHKPRSKSSPLTDNSFFGLEGKRVLLVEDSPEIQILIKVFLQKKGVIVDFANNGLEGIEMANKNFYDLVLMDMQMPVVDGYTATERLRKQGYSKPIIALTAHAMKEDRDHCLKIGCNDYLTKPIDPPKFYQVIDSHA